MSQAYAVAPLVGTHLRQDHAGREAEEVMDAAHPLRVVLRQVVVDRDDVDALARERVEVRRQGRDQGLALTGLHLGDVAEVEGGATLDLHVVVPLADDPLRRLADRGEGLRHQVVEGLAVREPLLELPGHALELGVAHGDEVVLDRVHRTGHRLELAEDLALADAEDLVKDGWHESRLLEVLRLAAATLPRGWSRPSISAPLSTFSGGIWSPSGGGWADALDDLVRDGAPAPGRRVDRP